MTHDVYVRELLRFDAQRVGTSITWSRPGQADSTAGIVLMPPPADATFASHGLVLADGSSRTVALATLTDTGPDAKAHAAGDACVAYSDGNAVHLAFDPRLIANDRALLLHLWGGVAPALDAAGEHANTRVRDEQLEAFVRSEERVWREALGRLPGEIENLEYAVSRLEHQMSEQFTRLFDLRSRQRAMQIALPEAVRQAARQQHESVQRLVPGLYQRVDLKDSLLVAHLGPVTIEHEGDEVEVGSFDVSIHLESAEITIRNTTNVANGVHHPHVRSPRPEDICWGSLRPAATRLLAEREWAGLLVAAHRLLISYAEGDAYQPLSAWDPDHSDDETSDDDYDEEEDSPGRETCSLCLEETASDEVTWVSEEAVCLGCYESGTFRCAGCQRQFTSRQQARESTQCTGCWEASHFTCPACREVKAVSERAATGACTTCMDSGGWRVAAAQAPQEVAS